IKEIAADHKEEGTCLGSGGGATITVTSKEQLIIANTLPEALSIFLSMKNKKQVQAVIVKTEPLATSHEATIFREGKVPVLWLTDLERVKQWSNKKPCSILVSPQQGVVVD